VRVDGDVTFTGVLLVEGGVLGDLSCDGDAKGTLVVGQSGHVSGAIKAPHIIVSGRVSGPSESSESIEVQSGACLVGDMSYKEIEVHAGGVIEGLLTPRPMPTSEANRLQQGSPVQVPGAPADRHRGMQPADNAKAGTGFWQVTWGRRTLGWAVALLATVIAAVWVNGHLIPVAPPPGDGVLKSSSAINEPASAPAVSGESGGPQDAGRVVDGTSVPAAPGADSAAIAVVQGAAPGLAEVDPEKIVMVQGVNPRKPAGLISVTSKDPAVLFRKKRQDSSAGTRIELAEGATKTLSIAKDELFRVAEGRNLTIFYQGRMVPPRTVESGAWMSFVPQTPGAAND